MSTPFRFEISRVSSRRDEAPAEGLTWVPDLHPGCGGWVREFTTLEELMAFVYEHGDVVIMPKSNYPDTRRWLDVLEIYDDYRE